MAKIRWSRAVQTATCGDVVPGDVSDVTEQDAERYVRNGWAERVAAPVKKAAAKKADG